MFTYTWYTYTWYTYNNITLTGSKIAWWLDLRDVGGPVIDESREDGSGLCNSAIFIF